MKSQRHQIIKNIRAKLGGKAQVKTLTLDEKKHPCESLSSFFFEDTKEMLKKHFVAQWCGENLIRITLAAAALMPTVFDKWLAENPVPNGTAHDDLHEQSLRPSPIINFITKNESLSNVKSQELFLLNEDAIDKVAAVTRVFESIYDDAASLHLRAQQSWLTLASSAQLVESKAKDSSTCKVIVRSEEKSSTMPMVRSAISKHANLKFHFAIFVKLLHKGFYLRKR